MPRQIGFSTGEVAKELWAKTDWAGHAHAARRLRNFWVTPEGNAATRPGTRFDYDVPLLQGSASERAPARLHPFIFSGSDSAVLELTAGRCRIIRAGAPVAVTGTASTRAPAWSGATAYLKYAAVSKSSKLYQALLPSTNKDPATESSYWEEVTDGRVPLPYTQAEVWAATLDQSGDTIFISVRGHPVRALQRTGATTWVLSTWAWTPTLAAPTGLATDVAPAAWDSLHPKRAWDYQVTAYKLGVGGEESLPSSVLHVSDTTPCYPDRPGSIKWNTVSGADGYYVYKGLNGQMGYLGMATGLSFRDEGLLPIYEEPPPVGRDPFAAGGDAYPQVVGLHHQRLIAAASYLNPGTVWGTKASQLHSFDAADTPAPEDAFQATLLSDKFEEIVAMLSLGPLRLFTTESEWIFGPADGAPLTTATIGYQRLSGHGSSAGVHPVVIGVEPLFVTRDGRVRTSPLQADGGADLSLQAQHLAPVGQTIVSWAYSRELRTLWLVRTDGSLLSLSYIAERQQAAWALHPTVGKVYSVACIRESSRDQLYVCAGRTCWTGNALDGTGSEIEQFHVERLTETGAVSPHLWVPWDGAATIDGLAFYKAEVPVSCVFTSPDVGTQATFMATEDDPVFKDLVVGDWVVMNPFSPTERVVLKVVSLVGGPDYDTATVEILEGVPPLIAEAVGYGWVLDAGGTTEWGVARKGVRWRPSLSPSRATGLEHLANQEVWALVDGEPRGPFKVELQVGGGAGTNLLPNTGWNHVAAGSVAEWLLSGMDHSYQIGSLVPDGRNEFDQGWLGWWRFVFWRENGNEAPDFNGTLALNPDGVASIASASVNVLEVSQADRISEADGEVWFALVSDWLPVAGDETYSFTCYTGVQDCKVQLAIAWFDANRQPIGQMSYGAPALGSSNTYASSGPYDDEANFYRTLAVGTSPESARYAALVLLKGNSNNGATSSRAVFAAPQFEVGATPTGWVAPELPYWGLDYGDPGVVVTVGLPVVCELETLDAVHAPVSNTIVREIGLEVIDSMLEGVQVAETIDGPFTRWTPEPATPSDAGGAEGLLNATVRSPVDSTWGQHGRAALRACGQRVVVAGVNREID